MTATAATVASMNFRRMAIPLPCFGFLDHPIKVAGLSIKHRPFGPMRQFTVRKAEDYLQCPARCEGPEKTPTAAALLDRADQVLDLLGVRAELLGELVEIRIGHGNEAGLI